MSSNEKTTFENGIDQIMQTFTSVYVFAFFCIMPLYMERKYLNMGDAKYHFFLYGSVVILGFLIVFGVQKCFLIWDSYRNQKPREILKRFSATDYCVVAFALISIISCIFAHDKQWAVWGFSGWNMGLVSQLIFVMIFIFVSRYFKWNPTVIECAIVVGGIVYFIAVLQRFDMDIFGLYMNKGEDGVYRKLDDMYIEKFVSTLGQTSWYSGYAILILPFGMYWYMASKKTIKRVLSGIFVMLGAASLCTVNSDSAYIAIAIIMLVFFWYAFDSNESMLRFMEIVLIFLASFRVIGLLQDAFPERMIHLISGEEKITKFINHSSLMLGVLAFIFLLYIYMYYANKERRLNVAKFSALRELAVWTFIVGVWAVVMLMILTTKQRLPVSLEKLYGVSFLNFDVNWGNYRGFNWRMGVGAFNEAGFKDKLIGVGPDSFAWSMNTYFKNEVSEFWHGLQLACAHNEWLNMLVTEGILGLVAYLGIFVTSAYRLAKNASINKLAIPCLAAVVAYIGYNFFCYQTCLCTPYIFVVMGMGEMMIRNAPDKKVSDNKKAHLR